MTPRCERRTSVFGLARRHVLVCLLLAFLAAACAAPAASPAPAPATAAPRAATTTPATSASPAGASAPAAPAKVRVGTVGSLVDAPIFIAQERGYFAEAGLEVEEVRADGATQLMAPLAAGQIEILGASMSAGFYNAFARDIDVRIVADKGRIPPGRGNAGLVVRKDLYDSGAVRSLADLRGRRVGLAGYGAGSAVTLFLGHGMETRGLSLSDVDAIDIVLGDLNAALANSSLDAAIQIEPLLTVGLANGLYGLLMRSDELYPDLQSGFVLYAADFIRNQNELGRRWMVAFLRGVRDYVDAFDRNRGRDEVVAILARNTGVKDPSLYDRMVAAYMDPNGRLNVPTLIEAQDWFAAHGYIPRKVDVPSLIDYQFVDYAVGVLGEYH